MKALEEKGGITGLMTFAVGPGEQFNREDGGWDVGDPRFQKWLDHCDHIVKLVGTDHVG